jgi:hypothetical protein
VAATTVRVGAAGKLLELGTDTYTEIVLAPQGGRLW